LSQIDRFSAYMRGLSYLVTTETSTACRRNKSQNLQQKCGTWGEINNLKSKTLSIFV
jgi:hypothetical protein